MFFKIESWNFQNPFEKEFLETSQNFNSIRQQIEKMKATIVWISWMSWNFVRFHEIQFQIDAKSVIPKKKYFLSSTTKICPKDGASSPNFQWRFCILQPKLWALPNHHISALMLPQPGGPPKKKMHFSHKSTGLILQKTRVYLPPLMHFESCFAFEGTGPQCGICSFSFPFLDFWGEYKKIWKNWQISNWRQFMKAS